MPNTPSALDSINIKVRELRRQYELVSPRDRIMLNSLVVFLVIVIGFFLVVKPAFNAVEQAQLTLKGKQELLQWMKSNEHRAKSISGSGSKTKKRRPGQSLLALINQTSGRFQVPLKRYEPEGDDKLRVWVEDIPFNSLVRWLNTLESSNAVSVINISIDSQKDVGIINAKVVFKG